MREHLTSWKEIADYMGSGVRTVQRYEREFGLPVRRPTGKSRGSVMATRAEIDAWVAAAPIRETFRLSRELIDSRTQANANKLEAGINAMRKLKDQMQALRSETRTVLNLLVNSVSSFHALLPSSRPEGYQPLVNMDVYRKTYSDESVQEAHAALQRIGSRRNSIATRLNISKAASKPH